MGEYRGGPINDFVISEDVFCDAVRRVLADTEAADVPLTFESRIDDLHLTSLQFAEVIVEVEERLDVLLDLWLTDHLTTLKDLAGSLRKVRLSE